MSKLIALFTSAAVAATSAVAFTTNEPAYLLSTATGDFQFSPLVTVGDYLPHTSGGANPLFGLVGIPDAMGLYKDPVTAENILFVAHELPSGVLTKPFPGGPTYAGAWVSRLVLDNTGGVTSGGFAHKNLYVGHSTLVQDHPVQEGEGTGFTRFCSGSFAGPAHGMDRPIFLTNEESAGGTFDAAGSQTVAIYDGAMHTVPALGRIVRENTLVMPRRDALTAVISTEDGGTALNPFSYVYLYVGSKNRNSSDVLAKNGLAGGKIYVLAGRDADAGKTEASFSTGSIQTRWVEIPNGATLNSEGLNTAAMNAGGYGIVRVEDGEFDPVAPTRALFVAATGGSTPNRLGRLYKVNFNPLNPAANGSLEIIFNADNEVAAKGDFCVSIDNIAVTKNYIVVCEDRNAPADAVFAANNRTGGVWTLDRNNNYAAKYQASFNYAYTNTRDGVTRTAGLWESSGVIDASAIYGADTFIINVQAHGSRPNGSDRTNISKPTGGVYTDAEANSLFAEDGQILIMRPKVVAR